MMVDKNLSVRKMNNKILVISNMKTRAVISRVSGERSLNFYRFINNKIMVKKKKKVGSNGMEPNKLPYSIFHTINNINRQKYLNVSSVTHDSNKLNKIKNGQ